MLFFKMSNKMVQRYTRLVTFQDSLQDYTIGTKIGDTLDDIIGDELDIEHIMRLGGWESLDMVVRYRRSVRFEERLRLYRCMEKVVIS
jgi:hypothetical protein